MNNINYPSWVSGIPERLPTLALYNKFNNSGVAYFGEQLKPQDIKIESTLYLPRNFNV